MAVRGGAATVGALCAMANRPLLRSGYMLDRGIHSVLEFGIGCQLLGLVAHVLLPSNFSLGEYGSIITLACLVSSIKHRALRSGVALGLLSIIASALLMLRVPNLFYALLPTLGACVVMALRRRNLRVVLGPYSDMERLARIWGVRTMPRCVPHRAACCVPCRVLTHAPLDL